eukprot:scaffold1161_cov70-Cylindrotheca_fusiformis.AAC.2
MQAEFNDHNSWHLGPKARGFLLQMVANEVVKRRLFYDQTKAPETLVLPRDPQEPSKATSMDEPNIAVVSQYRYLHILSFLVLSVIVSMRRSIWLKMRNGAMEAVKLLKEAPTTTADDDD